MSNWKVPALSWGRGPTPRAKSLPIVDAEYTPVPNSEDRIQAILRQFERQPGFVLRFQNSGKVRGRLIRFTHHNGRYGAVVRFDRAEHSYHGFFVVLEDEVVHRGEAPPPPKKPYRETVLVTRTYTR